MNNIFASILVASVALSSVACAGTTSLPAECPVGVQQTIVPSSVVKRDSQHAIYLEKRITFLSGKFSCKSALGRDDYAFNPQTNRFEVEWFSNILGIGRLIEESPDSLWREAEEGERCGFPEGSPIGSAVKISFIARADGSSLHEHVTYELRLVETNVITITRDSWTVRLPYPLTNDYRSSLQKLLIVDQAIDELM
jgi:hypothetical protein